MIEASGGRWRVSGVTPDDKGAIQALFQQVFGHPLADDLWRWKYADGHGRAVLVWQGSDLVAHYGGVARDVRVQGKHAVAAQICDVMVRQSERGVLTRRGPFMLAASAFLEGYVGGGRDYLQGYGFPTQRALAAAERQGLYTRVDAMAELAWEVLDCRSSWLSRCSTLNAVDKGEAEAAVDQAWQCMQSDLLDAVVGVRDWAYVQRRYLAHPVNRYEVCVVRQRVTRRVKGVFVLRHEGERCQLMDVIGALAEFPALLHHARRKAHSLGAAELYLWITESHLHCWPEGRHGALDMVIPANVWRGAAPVDNYRGAWWLTAGDTDFR